ncbi:MAG: 4-alpha-glucanotransferase [Chloroflexota bacterium]
MNPPTPRRDRVAGVLLHPTSLPGPHGVGDLGAGAYRFVEFLERARQGLWQIMPLAPVGLGNSPYAAGSAFAGNPLLIALDQLVGRGWLDPGSIEAAPFPAERADYAAAGEIKERCLRQAFARFGRVASAEDRVAFATFAEAESHWLADYALFCAIKHSQGGRFWLEWPRPLRLREAGALVAAAKDLADEVAFHQWVQWLFAGQWESVRSYANVRGIRIIGDIPIFVALDSADVWTHRHQFLLDEHGRPTVVAGVPPDAFSETGQRWGNPLYAWDRMAADGYRWWVARFKATFRHVDVVRLDHFRGFQAYWEVPATEETAINGRWVPGPGQALFDAVSDALGHLPIVIEDLGEITPDVIQLAATLGFPGMKVLQFAFGDDAGRDPVGDSPYLPHNFVQDCVVYSGTHDNDTSAGWYAHLGDAERESLLCYAPWVADEPAGSLVRMAYASVADWAIVPLQDVLGLGSEGRMNVPGVPDGNWEWRFAPEALTDAHAARLSGLVGAYGRARAAASSQIGARAGV